MHSSHQFKTSLDMFSESYQIASYIVFISGVLGILGALAEFTFLRAFVHFKVLRALKEFKFLRALLIRIQSFMSICERSWIQIF